MLFRFKTNNQNRVIIKAFSVKDKNVSYPKGKLHLILLEIELYTLVILIYYYFKIP